MESTFLVISAVVIYGAQSNRINQNVHISGLGESDFAVYRQMNDQNAIITEYPRERFTRVQLLQSPYTECFVPNDNLKPIPSLQKVPRDTRGLIARYLGSGSKGTPFRLTNRENNAAVSGAREFIREDDLRAINRDFRYLIEETSFTAERILDLSEWIPLRLAAPKGRGLDPEMQKVADYYHSNCASRWARGSFEDSSNVYLVKKDVIVLIEHENIRRHSRCPAGHFNIFHFRQGEMHGTYRYGTKGEYIDCTIWRR